MVPTDHRDRDFELFQAVQAGDGRALAELYDKYSSLVYTYALRVCGDHEWAEEVTQDTFVRLWTTRSVFDPSRSQFHTWLLTIARRLSHDKWRKFKSLPLLESDISGVDATSSVAERTWFRQEVLALLQGLSDEERQVVELAYFQGLTLREVAEHLQRPLGTVKTRLNHALAVLRRDLQAWKGGFQA